MPRPNIIARHSLFSGDNRPIRDFKELADRFTCRVAYDGPDYLRFTVDTSQVTIRVLARWFETMLGTDMRVQTSSEIPFRGFLYTMKFFAGGDGEYRTLEKMANRAIVQYDSGDAETGVIVRADNGYSVRKFGRKLIRLEYPEITNATDAANAARGDLLKLQNGIALPLAESDRTEIEFEYVGYIAILSWLEVTITAGQTIQDALKQLIDTCGQGIISYTNDSIQDNGAALAGDVEGDGLRVLRALLAIESTGDQIWRFWIDENLIAHFEPVDLQPYYVKRVSRIASASGTFVGLSGSQRIGRWEARAGVIRRNTAYPITGREDGSWFLDRRDRFVEAVRFDIDGAHTFETLDEDFPETRVLGFR